MAQGGGRGALDRLVAAGLVARTWASPNLILFALNREHLAVDAAPADGELAAAPWLLVAGSRPCPLALVDDVVPPGTTVVPVDP